MLAVAAVSSALAAIWPNPEEGALLALSSVVLAGAWYGGFLAGITATVGSLLVASYFFLPPLHSFRIASGRDVFYLSLVAGEGLFVSLLCEQRGRLREAAARAHHELAAARADVQQTRRDLTDVEADLRRIELALPRWIGPALQTLREGREAMQNADRGRAGWEEAHSRMSQAEQRIAAFSSALESYAGRCRERWTGRASSQQVLDEVTGALDPLAAGAGARIVLPRQAPVVSMTKADLFCVFHELFSNAIRFRSAEPPVIGVAWCANQGSCVFTVSDNGAGMIPLQVAEAFVLFGRRGSEDGQHLGAGLAVSRRIVRSYGGDMWLESSPGRGTTVSFTVPLGS
jgi:signal transduction histidine kinase